MIFSSEALWKVYLCSRPLDLGSANVIEDSEVEQDDQQEGDDGDEKDTKIPGDGSVEDEDDSDGGNDGNGDGKVGFNPTFVERKLNNQWPILTVMMMMVAYMM